MQDARTGRKQSDSVIGLHRPFDETEALCVAADLQRHVSGQRVRCTGVVEGQGVVENHVDRNLRADVLDGPAERLDRAADGGQIAEQGNSGSAVEHDAADRERQLVLACGARLPESEIAHLLLGHAAAIAMAHHRFQHDAQR
jgi:hypothetical protein